MKNIRLILTAGNAENAKSPLRYTIYDIQDTCDNHEAHEGARRKSNSNRNS